ncbi:MAG TPA: tetratricopeptide repeat protein [Symbiobacteriaceae bacterium]|nr:tetratricopeptide repeat protein [Symbiobacteriaceae bacterium]
MEIEEIQQLKEEADRLYKEGRLERALDVYGAITEAAPDHAWAHSRIGAIMAQWDRLDEAEAALRRAIELDPQMAQAHSNLGNILYVRGEFEGALQKYQEAIAINPDNPVFHQNLHAANKKLGKLADAVAALKRSHKLERQATKDEAKAQFAASSQRIKRRLGCLPATLLLLGTLIILGTATLL